MTYHIMAHFAKLFLQGVLKLNFDLANDTPKR